MSDAPIRDTVLRALGEAVPDADVGHLDPDRRLRGQLDYFDSIDFLNFVEGLHKAFNLDIPERDYPHLATLAGCVDYLQTRLAAR